MYARVCLWLYTCDCGTYRKHRCQVTWSYSCRCLRDAQYVCSELKLEEFTVFPSFEPLRLSSSHLSDCLVTSIFLLDTGLSWLSFNWTFIQNGFLGGAYEPLLWLMIDEIQPNLLCGPILKQVNMNLRHKLTEHELVRPSGRESVNGIPLWFPLQAPPLDCCHDFLKWWFMTCKWKLNESFLHLNCYLLDDFITATELSKKVIVWEGS